MIAAHPTGVTLADIYREEGSNPATGLGVSVGSTCDPEDLQLPRAALRVRTEYRHPDFRVRNLRALGVVPHQPTPPQYVADYNVIQHATEGTNRSIYLREGIYETNYTIELDELDQSDLQWRTKVAGAIKERRSNEMSAKFGVDPQPRVYFWMPAAMAERSRAAEEEHLADIRRAYAMTLGAMNDALDRAGCRAASDALARQGAEAAWRAALPAAIRHLGGDMASWGQRYLALCAKSFGRDAGDHSFGLELVDPLTVPAIPPTYLTAGPREENGRVILKVVTGTTRVPGHRTEDLIVY